MHNISIYFLNFSVWLLHVSGSTSVSTLI